MKLNVGVVGFGYWGPNLARNFSTSPFFELKRIADWNPKRRQAASQAYRYTDISSDAKSVTQATDIDVVVIATPVSSHYALAAAALKNGKHVWIEKPITSSYADALKLQTLAAKKRKIVLVDHTLLFTGAVQKIKNMLSANELGKLYYYDSVRVNLGLFQHDVNVLWDLAAHDLSIMDYLLGPKAQGISAVGAKHLGTKEAVAYLSVSYPENLLAHFHVNWLSPVKIRKTIVGGSKKMLVWNDLDPDEALKIYDKGVKIKKGEGVYKLLPEYRIGQMHSPVINQKEALKSEVAYFADCIARQKTPHNDIRSGARVVRLLEAADKSLKKKGAFIRL